MGVPTDQANIHALIHELSFGGNSFVFNDVMKKLTNPVAIVTNTRVDITYATVKFFAYLKRKYSDMASNES